ncbi:MmcQ/YjbR family DNA-binding protein, partial [Micromonospora wenchangensis]
MTREEMLAYCLGKPGAWLDRPWEGDEVVKVGSRIFAFLGAPDGTTRGQDRPEGDQVRVDARVRLHVRVAGPEQFLGVL